jgi:hypothetical protein
MIAKQTSGSDFGGSLGYQMKPKEPRGEHEKEQYKEKLKESLHTPGEHAPPFEAGERHRILGGNMSGRTKEDLTREFEAVSSQRPDIEKPVHHVSLSLGETDKLTVDQWLEIAQRYIKEMGFKDSPYLVIQHRDGKVDHIHILTSRVDTRGQVVSDWKCKERAEKVLRGIEKDYGLEQLKSSHEVERAAPKRGEIETFNRTGQLSIKMELQGHVEVSLKDSPTATEFIEKLQAVGVDVIPYIGKEGRATGVSFRKGKQLMKGSDLGRGFSWNALQERGLSYDPERDRPAIEAARGRADTGRAQVIEPPALSTPTPQYGVMDFAKDAGKAVGQYVLDQVNPPRQIEGQIQSFINVSRTVVEGYNLTRDLLTKQDPIDRLNQAAGIQPTGHDALDKLNQSVGLESTRDTQDALQRLNEIAGVGRNEPSLTQGLDKTLEQSPAATFEPAIGEEVAEHAIEHTLEILMF